MIKQNIKIAIVTIILFITFWLVMFNFIKIDKTSQCVLSFNDSVPTLAIEAETSAYIEKKGISYVKVQFNKQYFECHITFVEYTDEYSTYLVILPKEEYKSQQYMVTNVIVDSQNLYQYWFKK